MPIFFDGEEGNKVTRVDVTEGSMEAVSGKMEQRGEAILAEYLYRQRGVRA